MRLCLAATAALLLVGLFCFPAGAGADLGHFWLPGGRSLVAEFKGSNGYRIHVSSFGRNVHLRTEKGGISTEYSVRGVFVGPDRMRAKLSGWGSISVRFHPHGAVRHTVLSAQCKGPRATVQRGVVRGTIRFVGEREYTRVERREARAESYEWKPQRCRVGTPAFKRRAKGLVGSFLAWEWKEHALQTFFTVNRYRRGVVEGGRVVFDVGRGSTAGTVDIYRHATIVAPGFTFQVPEPDTYPEHVVLAPPAPFAGTGTFTRTPESTFAWEGDLSIQFPGVDPLPLTGPRFETHYCALRGCADQSPDESEPLPVG